MNDHIALHETVPTTQRKSRRLKRGVCALAAAMTLGSIAGGAALAAAGSTAVAGKGGTMVSPLGNSWR
jgi:hypothetical protein